MSSAVRGRLISGSFAAEILPSLDFFERPPLGIRRAMERCAENNMERLGPAASVRSVADVAVIPLLHVLGFSAVVRGDTPSTSLVHTVNGTVTGPPVVITAYGASLERVWRTAVHGAIATDTRWCFCCNGQHLRVVDARRTWSRACLEFDLRTALEDAEGQALIWTLLSAHALLRSRPALDRAVEQSARHGADVCRALGRGVLEAISVLLTTFQRKDRTNSALLFDHSLTVVYRVLFLLFAEARGLVPVWHPVYRDRYSVNTIVVDLLAGRPGRGLWQALHAISRLAHTGCAVGELKVTAFNGRLFSPSHASSFERRPIADAVMREAIVSVSSTPAAAGQPRTRISYRDLDVEQLGTVYEQVLDYEPETTSGVALVRTRDARKSSGAFYTPRPLTAALVRRALEPLVKGRTSEDVLRLRIVDPAMGSGAFLVAACRYLASAVEDAFIREGRWHPADITDGDRALLRRDIATRCLYGVDLNPMAVQLARLSLWLATLASDRPLSFLDHHLVVGDSLVGASPIDVHRQPSGQRGQRGRLRALPLFETAGLAISLNEDAHVRTRLASEPDDTAAIVHQKERTLAVLAEQESATNRWRRVLDLWCAGWFWNDAQSLDRGAFAELMQQLLTDDCSLPEPLSRRLLAQAASVSASQRFFHWQLEFPEVFGAGGFDAVIGNPPWDMVRGDSGAGDARDDRRRLARCTTGFFRGSGVYVVEPGAHANRYQLFVERSLQLLREGGRLGLILPGGIASDTSSAPLRRHLFDRARVDSLTGLDNRAGIFPIHRSVRFALVTASAGTRTERIACRFGVTEIDDLESPAAKRLDISRDLLGRISGPDDLGIPELLSEHDLRIVERVSTRVPRLASATGWGAQFGRELNATDDRGAFRARSPQSSGRPVVEGKHLESFRVNVDKSRLELRAEARAARRVPCRARLAYREVASATNRLTLIAAIVPPEVVTTHTVFCLKTPLPPAHQRVLCALLNSFVANYLIRLRVHTHVTANLLARLPVPCIGPDHPAFDRLDAVTLLLTRASNIEASPEYAELQAVAAELYGLTIPEFEHVLTTFPLIPESTRRASLERFSRDGLSR